MRGGRDEGRRMTNVMDVTPGSKKPFSGANRSPETGEEELGVTFALLGLGIWFSR